MMKAEFPNNGHTGPSSKLTPEKQEEIISWIRRKVPVAVFISSVGINRDTFYTWIKKGTVDIDNEQDTEYSRLVIEVTRARALNCESLINTVIKGKKGWQGSAWLLERDYRESFAINGPEIASLKAEFDYLREVIAQSKIKPGDCANG